MVREGLVCFFDGNEEIKPRFRLAGAVVGVPTCLYHIGNKTQTYKVLVENMLLPKCLDFVHAMLCTFFRCLAINMLKQLSFFSRNININGETLTPQKVNGNINAAKSGFAANN